VSNKIKVALITAVASILVAIISSYNTSNNQSSIEVKQTSYGEKSQNIKSEGTVNTVIY